jgi:PTH2 family peptidyl-tRNA hydrolase
MKMKLKAGTITNTNTNSNSNSNSNSNNDNNDDKYNMYVLVNDDLKMGKGKIAGQVGHVVGLITEEIIRKSYETKKVPDCYLRYIKWKNTGHSKIILKATCDQITSFIGHPESMYILDAGKTQIAPNSLTVLGFYPSATLKEQLKNFKLL